MSSESIIAKAKARREAMAKEAEAAKATTAGIDLTSDHAESGKPTTVIEQPKTENKQETINKKPNTTFKKKQKRETKSRQVHLTMYPQFYKLIDSLRPDDYSLNEFIESLIVEALEHRNIKIP